MVSTMQRYSLGAKTVDIDLLTVPTFSKSSEKLLTSINGFSINLMSQDKYESQKNIKNKSGSFAATILNANRISTDCTAFYKFELQDRVKNINDLQDALQNTQANGNKQKLIACLKVALLAAFVAGAVLLGVFGGVVGIVFAPMMALPFVIAAICMFCDAQKKIDSIEEKKGIPLSRPWYEPSAHIHLDPRVFLGLIGAFILPIFEAFTREERIQRILQDYLAQTSYLDANHQKIERNLAQEYEFYTSHADEISLKLDQMIDKLEASLGNLNESDVGHFTDVADSKRKIRATIEDCKRAKQEFENAALFYKQFDDEILEADSHFI